MGRYGQLTKREMPSMTRLQGLLPAILFRPGAVAAELIAMKCKDFEGLMARHGLTGAGARVLQLNFPVGLDR
jgi:hypothetical protein